MSSLNKIILVGVIETEVDEKVTTSGHTVAKFKLKVDRNDNSPVQKSDTFDVVCWNETAEQVRNLSLGQICVVEGRISNRSYETDMGQRKYVTEIEARKVNLITGSEIQSTSKNYEPKLSSNSGEPQFEFDSTPDIARAIQDSAESEVDVPF